MAGDGGGNVLTPGCPSDVLHDRETMSQQCAQTTYRRYCLAIALSLGSGVFNIIPGTCAGCSCSSCSSNVAVPACC